MIINEDTPIVMLTIGQLREALGITAKYTPKPAATSKSEKRYVYGIKGIADLLHVSKATAQKFKDGVLRGAVMQQGRTIVVDAEKAIELFEQSSKK